jgi:hypothetical protein
VYAANVGFWHKPDIGLRGSISALEVKQVT